MRTPAGCPAAGGRPAGRLSGAARTGAAAWALHLIVDNSSTHTTEAIRDFLAAHPRFHLHFTPTSASWLNAVETWFGQLERRALRRGVFTSVSELRDEIRRFIETHNLHSAKPFRRTKVGQRYPRCCRKGSRNIALRNLPHGTLVWPVPTRSQTPRAWRWGFCTITERLPRCWPRSVERASRPAGPPEIECPLGDDSGCNYSHACPSLSRSLDVFRLYVRLSASSHESRYVPPFRLTPRFHPASRMAVQF